MPHNPDPNPGSHADIHRRHPLSAPGKYFVDDGCMRCELCREMAPTIFRADDLRVMSYVARQPVTAEEIALVKQCVEMCCVLSIGDTGEQHDWEKLPATRCYEPTERPPEEGKDCPNCRSKET